MIPSSGEVRGLSHVGAEKTIVRGHLKIVGGVIHNTARVKTQPSILLDTSDDVLECVGVHFKGESFDLGGNSWSCNRLIEMNGGGRLILDGCTYENGDFVLGRRGRVEIRGCEGLASTYGYNFYFGDCNTNPADVVEGIIEACEFSPSRREASVRAMGFNGTIRECRFKLDGWQNDKEFLQLRHGRIVVDRCSLLPVAVGPLKYDDPGDKGASYAYAARHPTFVYFRDSSIEGPIRMMGNVAAAVEGLLVKGRDPRNGRVIFGKRYEDENCVLKSTSWQSPQKITQVPAVICDAVSKPDSGMATIVGSPGSADMATVKREAGWRGDTPQPPLPEPEPEPGPDPQPAPFTVTAPPGTKEVRVLIP